MLRPAGIVLQDEKYLLGLILDHDCDGALAGADRSQVRRDMTTMGEVVGWLVPPAGSTVTPTLSPAASPEASTGAVLPDAGAGSRPARRIRGGPISHSS